MSDDTALLRISNFRNIEAASLPIARPITIIGGTNRAGKTSVCLALQACLTGKGSLLTGKKADDGFLLVKQGAKMAKVGVHHDDASRVLTFLASGTDRIRLTKKGAANLPSSSLYAASVIGIPDLGVEARATAFAGLFGTLPTLIELDRAIATSDLSDCITKQMREDAAKLIEKAGWDKAEDQMKESARLEKGAWQHIAGQRWGAKIVDDWEPEGFVAGVTLRDLEKQQSKLSKAYDTAQRAIGASDAEIERLEALVGSIPDLDEKAELAAKLLAQAVENRQSAEQAMKNAPIAPSETNPPTPCPHCGKHLLVQAGKVVAFEEGEGLPAEEIEARRAHYENVSSRLLQAKSRESDLRNSASAEVTKLRQANVAAETLGRAKKSSSVTSDDVEIARAELGRVRKMIKALDDYEKADKVADNIAGYLAVGDMLAPDGLRMKKLTEMLSMINGSLAEIGTGLCREPVSIDNDLTIKVGSRPFDALFGSEKWCARAALAIEAAKRDNSSMVVLDGADILDRSGRNGLFKTIKKAGVNAVIFMTANHPKFIPDVGTAGMGLSWWIEDGTLKPLAEAVQERDARGKVA